MKEVIMSFILFIAFFVAICSSLILVNNTNKFDSCTKDFCGTRKDVAEYIYYENCMINNNRQYCIKKLIKDRGTNGTVK